MDLHVYTVHVNEYDIYCVFDGVRGGATIPRYNQS